MVDTEKTAFSIINSKNNYNGAIMMLLLICTDLIFVVIHIISKLTHDMECTLYCLK